jgi:hypothetical protein
MLISREAAWHLGESQGASSLSRSSEFCEDLIHRDGLHKARRHLLIAANGFFEP